jgi:hypothetical protein
MKLFRTCCAGRLAAIVSVSLISPVLIGLFVSAVWANTYPWDGGGGATNNFNNAANWNPDTTPGSGDTALFNLGSNDDNSDANANVIDQADFAFWKARVGVPPGSGAGASVPTPEPATMTLRLIGIATLCGRNNSGRGKHILT